MSSALEQAGASREPSQYAALTMDRGITGMWTQRSPLRDADVPYVYGKFYGASRFDSILDGINREVTAKLTYARRAGMSQYNSQTFPALNSFFSWRKIVNGAETITLIADGSDGNIYDATGPSNKTVLLIKQFGGGKARFEGVPNTLFITDAKENKKVMQPGPWAAQTSISTTQYAVGTTVTDTNGNIEYLIAMQVGTVTNVALTTKVVSLQFNASNFSVLPGMSFRLALSGATFLNNQLLIAQTVNGNTVTAFYDHPDYASTPDTGTATTNDVGTLATTGNSQPSWPGSYGGTVADGLSTWQNFGTPTFQWTPAPPTMAPTLGFTNGEVVFWQPFTQYQTIRSLLDSNGYINTSQNAGMSGGVLPQFGSSNTSPAQVQDGGILWVRSKWLGSNNGAPVGWQSGVTPATVGAAGGDAIVDSNGNLQICQTGSGPTGASAPTWNTTYGMSTTDNGLTWANHGPYLALAFKGRPYGYAYHSIDQSVSSLSPLSVSTNGCVSGAVVGGAYSTDHQVDSVWIFHTPDGQSTPLFIAAIPNNVAGGTWSFTDQLTDLNLNAFIAGPQNKVNNPPPIGMTAPLYHLGRMWAIYQNTVIVSGGPNTLVGNGNTAFAPANAFPIAEQPIRLFPTITSAGPGVLVWGRANVYIILGQGTPSSPFQQAALYMGGCGILSYDAVAKVGSTFYAFGNTAMIGGNVVGKAYSLDPSYGYVEFGFPIGDQLKNVTTGTGGKTPTGAPVGYLYNPANTYMTWAELGSGDTGLYLCDGSVGWFRYSPITSPESGFLWSPRAVIQGGTSAVAGVETSPGVTQLLAGPAVSGKITFRDSTVNTDWTGSAGVAYPSYDVKGCIQLCLTGEVAEIAHIHVVSMPTGARPLIGLLTDEIAPVQNAPFTWLSPTSPEPPDLKPLQSESVYSDRYSVQQEGTTGKCLFFQLGMDYGTQNNPDETLLFSIYGAKYAERKEQ